MIHTARVEQDPVGTLNVALNRASRDPGEQSAEDLMRTGQMAWASHYSDLCGCGASPDISARLSELFARGVQFAANLPTPERQEAFRDRFTNYEQWCNWARDGRVDQIHEDLRQKRDTPA